MAETPRRFRFRGPGHPRENSPSPDVRVFPNQAIEERLQAVERRNDGSPYFEAQNGNPQGAGGRHHHRSPSPRGRGGGGGRGGARDGGKGKGSELTKKTGRGGGRDNRRPS